MSNSIGKAVTVTLFGESHGPAVGAVLDGIAPGVYVDLEYIKERLLLRAPFGKISTARAEPDDFSILSGVYNGYTTGTPIAIVIENKNTKSADYDALRDTPRPSHADYTAYVKYGEHRDHRGGGHFSGRVTAALVAAGAICALALKDAGIKIGSHILSLHGIRDRELGDTEADIELLNRERFAVLDGEAKEKMIKEIELCAERGDSVGGILEVCALGLPAGVGEPWFDTLEGELAKMMLSIPGVKGIDFGLGFGFEGAYGSECNDAFEIKGGTVVTSTNNSGGINGGISNGMPITMRLAVKPTPSIFMEQDTVSLERMENTTLKLKGRHDPAIIHRVRAVADAACAIVLCDMISRAK